MKEGKRHVAPDSQVGRVTMDAFKNYSIYITYITLAVLQVSEFT